MSGCQRLSSFSANDTSFLGVQVTRRLTSSKVSQSSHVSHGAQYTRLDHCNGVSPALGEIDSHLLAAFLNPSRACQNGLFVTQAFDLVCGSRWDVRSMTLHSCTFDKRKVTICTQGSIFQDGRPQGPTALRSQGAPAVFQFSHLMQVTLKTACQSFERVCYASGPRLYLDALRFLATRKRAYTARQDPNMEL